MWTKPVFSEINGHRIYCETNHQTKRTELDYSHANFLHDASEAKYRFATSQSIGSHRSELRVCFSNFASGTLSQSRTTLLFTNCY